MTAEKESQFWEELWTREGGIKPGELFDKESPSPALVSLVNNGALPKPTTKTKSVLIPGMGRGYDATFLAASGAYERAVGLDLAETAVASARERLKGLVGTERPKDKSVEFVAGDFFDRNVLGEETFGLVYDYTFLCAIPPSMRTSWAKRMRDLIADDGELVTLMYPIPHNIEVDKNSGPPYPLSLDLYKSLLEPVGFSLDEYKVLPSELSHPGRDGSNGKISALGRWSKK